MASEDRERLLTELHEAGRALSNAAVMYHSALSASMGLGMTEEKTLDLLEREGPLTAGEIVKRTGLAPASVSGLLDRLEHKGFVRRVRDPADRRRVIVEIDRDRVGAFDELFTGLVTRLNKLYAGYTDEQLPTQQTINTKLNRLGYRLTKVAKCRPQKRSPRPTPSSSG